MALDRVRLRRQEMSKLLRVLTLVAFGFASVAALAADDAYKAVVKQANETYKADKKARKPLKGDERKNCLHQAKAKHDQEIGEARKMRKQNAASGGSAAREKREEAREKRQD